MQKQKNRLGIHGLSLGNIEIDCGCGAAERMRAGQQVAETEHITGQRKSFVCPARTR